MKIMGMDCYCVCLCGDLCVCVLNNYSEKRFNLNSSLMDFPYRLKRSAVKQLAFDRLIIALCCTYSRSHNSI